MGGCVGDGLGNHDSEHDGQEEVDVVGQLGDDYGKGYR
jgi:hypothetical protein